jgi:putrescine aminotransferase
MVRQTGDAMIMSPPFVTTTGEIDALIATLTEGLDKTATHFGVKS